MDKNRCWVRKTTKNNLMTWMWLELWTLGIQCMDACTVLQRLLDRTIHFTHKILYYTLSFHLSLMFLWNWEHISRKKTVEHTAYFSLERVQYGILCVKCIVLSSSLRSTVLASMHCMPRVQSSIHIHVTELFLWFFLLHSNFSPWLCRTDIVQNICSKGKNAVSYTASFP